jgi:putative SOS response-associated peptidase YedK
MCGRFTQRYTWSEVLQFLRVFGPARNLQPHYNIAPTMKAHRTPRSHDVLAISVASMRILSPSWPRTVSPFFLSSEAS